MHPSPVRSLCAHFDGHSKAVTDQPAHGQNPCRQHFREAYALYFTAICPKLENYVRGRQNGPETPFSRAFSQDCSERSTLTINLNKNFFWDANGSNTIRKRMKISV
jgi:hypothetical protein